MDGDAIRGRLAAGETVVMAGCFDALSAKLAARRRLRDDVPVGLRHRGDAARPARLRLPHADGDGRGRSPGVRRRARGGGHRRRRHRLRQPAQHHPHGRALRARRRGRASSSRTRCGRRSAGTWPASGRAPRGLAGEAAGRARRARPALRHARTDARAAVGLDEACERARMAADLGVDAIFVEAPESLEEMEAIAAATPGCIRVANMIEGGRTPLRTPAELHDLGFDLIVSPLTGLLAATRQMRPPTRRCAARGTLRDDLDLVTSFDEFAPIVDLDATTPPKAATRRRHAARMTRVSERIRGPADHPGRRGGHIPASCASRGARGHRRVRDAAELHR